MPHGMQQLHVPAGHLIRKHGICCAMKLDMLSHVTVSLQLAREAKSDDCARSAGLA